MNTKSRLFLAALGAVAAFSIFPSNAAALTMTGTLGYGSRHSGNGGEFNFNSADFNPSTMGYASSATFNGGFETFCVEANEYFNPGGTYYYSISSAAYNGGISGGNPDPLSIGAAWLYSNFAQGTLAGYDYSIGSGGNASAAALQTAIWWLEGEIATQDNTNAFENAVVAMFGSAAGAMGDNAGAYAVGVLNIWGNAQHTKFGQDQLVLLPVPDGGTTVMLLGLGLLSVCLSARIFNRKGFQPVRRSH
jgi:hypothetical protein